MGLVAYATHFWKLGAVTIALYAGIMVLAYRRLWSVYLKIRPSHTQADVKVFNRMVGALNLANSFALLALIGLHLWLYH